MQSSTIIMFLLTIVIPIIIAIISKRNLNKTINRFEKLREENKKSFNDKKEDFKFR
ncbi:uncharacterized protein (UPF0335 family) [Raoultella sp. BIGb0132]|nr:uncharacterized protein (UPF0335 family) [Raoultella sp. BIGb0132]MCS4288519.1 uncharacterized protein (UPF0335 family) [Raoultella terrigena]